MGNSLQDQLLKAGLVSEQKLKQVRSSKRKKGKQAGGKGRVADEDLRRARQAAAEKAERDRALNLELQDQARRRAEENELRQLIHTHRISRRDGDVAYSFQQGDSLKRIYVTAEQQRGLARGKFGLVRQDKGYELLPAEVVQKIRDRKPELILVYVPPGEKAAEDTDGEGEYAQYQVPDDLMW